MVEARQVRRLVFSSAIIAGTITTSFLPGRAGAVPSAARTSSQCATLRLSATPKVNAQNAPYETIKNTVTNCSTATETVAVTQHVIGPYKSLGATGAGLTWIVTLGPGGSNLKTQHIPYSCCGTYTVRDVVTSSGGQVLAKKTVYFTFA
jgi:hypothetical protein